MYGGWGDYAKQSGQPISQIQQGGVMGARVTENFWNYFALEQDAGFYSYHRLVFRGATPNGVPLPVFGTHVYQGSFNGVLHFTPRDSKFRPFVTVGARRSELRSQRQRPEDRLRHCRLRLDSRVSDRAAVWSSTTAAV